MRHSFESARITLCTDSQYTNLDKTVQVSTIRLDSQMTRIGERNPLASNRTRSEILESESLVLACGYAM